MNLQSHWQLNPSIDFLNHGSFGATPKVVLEAQQRFQDAIEADPIRFLAPERDLEPKLDHVREVLSELLGLPARDLAFVRNATDGVNAVLRSFPLLRGDQIVVTDHGYNACINAARFSAEQSGAIVRVAKVPFPIQHDDQVVSAVESEFSPRTRMVLIDHVTSPTGLIFPIQKVIDSAHARGIRVMVDGAHGPGMLPLDLGLIDADYYTANHHKWLCAPKSSGFLYVRPEFQAEVRPTVISHAANRPRPGRSRFLAEFDWTGTFDPTPLLALPAAIEFLESLYPGGINELMASNRGLALEARLRLCDSLQIEPPAPESMIGSLVSIPLPEDLSADGLGARLYQKHHIEVPVFRSPKEDGCILRFAIQAYNCIEQIDRLIQALHRERKRGD